MLGISESMYNIDLEVNVEIKATPVHIYIEDLEANRVAFIEETNINGNEIKWNKFFNDISCIVVYGDYRYYITLFDSNDETQLFSLIEELLQ